MQSCKAQLKKKKTTTAHLYMYMCKDKNAFTHTYINYVLSILITNTEE